MVCGSLVCSAATGRSCITVQCMICEGNADVTTNRFTADRRQSSTSAYLREGGRAVKVCPAVAYSPNVGIGVILMIMTCFSLSCYFFHISTAEFKAFPKENNYLRLTFPPTSHKESSSAPEAAVQYSPSCLAFPLSLCVLNNSTKYTCLILVLNKHDNARRPRN